MPPTSSRLHDGFTLVEMIVAIVVLGILLSLTSMFVRNQVETYFDVARRAELSDAADTAMRRMVRDLQAALPNSPRTPTAACVEFIPTKTGGRYRAESDGTVGSEFLDFGAADTTFNMYGPQSAIAAQQIAIGDLVAVYNLGIPGADAFVQDNTAAVVAPAPAWNAGSQETTLTIASKLFPLASASNRFHVIPGNEQVVSFICTGVGTNAAGDGTGVLSRSVRTLPQAAGAACPAVPIGTPVLLNNVSACSFAYTPGVLQRSGQVAVSLAVRRAGETVSLQYQVNVANTP
jgi:MSHA biogenesis protein MshO